MGGGTWSDDAYMHIKSDYETKTTDEVFTSRNMHKDMDPKGVKFRESRDSEEHPESLAIAVFLDETGSMGEVPEILVRKKLGALIKTLLAHGIDHPQVLFGGIGDQYSDTSPLQVGQFESETSKLDECLTNIFLEGWGGGQNMESYLLAWLFASKHTSIDCLEKRGQKGFLFTIGDEKTWDSVEPAQLKTIMGYSQSDALTAEQLLEEARRMYHVFHIHINSTGYQNDSDVFDSWKSLLGERFLVLEDYNVVGELIASTVAVIHGIDLKKVTSTFDSKTAALVKDALGGVSGSIEKSTSNTGIVEL